MNVDHPSVYLYFTFSFTFCRLRVYVEDEKFAREVLNNSGVQEWLEPDASKSWQDIDTRMLFDLTRTALPKILESRMKDAFASIKF